MKSNIFIGCLVIIILMCMGSPLQGAYLRNVPVTVTQPNGETLKLLASGDEFYNWIHDKDGYTIIQDHETGYYVYAIEQEGDLLPSIYPVSSNEAVNHYNREALGIPKYLKHSWEKRPKPKELFPEGSAANNDKIIQAPKTGTINNLVVFIRFSGESEYTDATSGYDSMFNSASGGANSMRNYFTEASYNQLTTSTTFYPTPGTTVVSYQDSQLRSYYQPYDASTNPNGYTGGDNGTMRRDREHTLLVNAINAIAAQVPGGLNLDGDSDGNVDNVCFIIYGAPTGWSSLLWPHMWSLYSQYVYINGKRVYTYNFQLQTSLASSGVGVLCHEMFHSLGAPDLYHYSMDGLYPVSSWGLMEFDSNPPRHMGAFMKWRYGTWISTLPPITNGEGEKPYMSTIIENGTYSLNPLTSNTNNCYKIASPNSTTEYFLVEYRKSVGTFENSLPGEGLLVYRINSNRDGLGNRNGPPDEVYIYRPGGTTSLNGDPDSANFSSDVGRTAINDSTDPSSFLSDGSAGGLNISNVTSVGSTISFTVTFTGGGTQTLTVQSQPASGASITVSPTDGNGQGNGATPFTRTYATGTAVTLTPAASFNGLPFMNWTLDGVVQTRENSSPEDLQNANELVVTMGSAHTAVANYGISIGQAVDNTSLTWTTGGDGGGWYGQTTTSHDGVDAAQNYDISHNQSNWVQTTVQGPGNLSFWWKASSELNYDGTIFYIDGAVQTSIHGNTAWRQETYPIAAGAHTLKWLYTKDGSIDFGSDAGWLDQVVYTTTATTWQQLTTVNPEGTITANTDGDTASEIIADFGSAWGLWHWNGGSWSELTSSSPEYVVSGDTDGDGQAEIVGDFGPGTGLYLWNGSWSQLTASDPDKVITGDVDNDGRAEVFGDFGSMGFWQWDSGWTQLTAADADNMIAADTDGNGDHEIVVDFGASGVWQRDGNAWTQLVASNPETMISGDLDGDGRAEIIADFGPLGLWQWNSQSGWSQLVGSDVEGMVCGDLDGNGDQEIVGDFGSLGLWQWNGGSGWSQLVGSNVEEAVCGDVDGDGRDEVIGDFGSLGVWTLSDSGWVELSSSDPDALLCADTDGTGDEEIIGDFGAQGLWLR